MFVAAMLVRPSLLGQNFTAAGSVLAFGIGLSSFLLHGWNRRLLSLVLLSQGSAIVLWLFLATHSVFSGVMLSYPLTAFITIVLCSGGACLGFSNRIFHDAFFSSLRIYLAFCGLSLVVTAVLSMAVGLNFLYLTTVTVRDYDLGGYADVYFPFTISYGYREVFGYLIPRCGAGFRESGISQAFFAFAILTIPQLRRPRDWGVLLLLLVGGLGAQSTTGMAIVGIAGSLRVLAVEGAGPKVRLLLLCLVLCASAVSVNIALNDETVGFAAKVESQSYLDRKFQTEKGIEYFLEHPLGAGVYSPQVNVGINLLASLGGIGIFGLFAVMLNLLMSWLGSMNKVKKGLAILPLFLTSLTSQPLLDAPFVYMCYGFLALTPTRSGLRLGTSDGSGPDRESKQMVRPK